MTVTFGVISHFTKTYVHWLYIYLCKNLYGNLAFILGVYFQLCYIGYFLYIIHYTSARLPDVGLVCHENHFAKIDVYTGVDSGSML